MRLLKSISFTLFLLVVTAAAAHAQANSLKKISFVFDRYSSPMTTDVRLIGDNIDVSAKFRPDDVPLICHPCTQLSLISLGPALADSGIVSAGGTIDGIYYQNLYVLHNFSYFNTAYGRVPRLWTKTVRVRIPVFLRGDIGIWRTPEEVGNDAVALYKHNGIEFDGTANFHLDWYLRPNEPRLYTDKYLSMEFAYAGDRASVLKTR